MITTWNYAYRIPQYRMCRFVPLRVNGVLMKFKVRPSILLRQRLYMKRRREDQRGWPTQHGHYKFFTRDVP